MTVHVDPLGFALAFDAQVVEVAPTGAAPGHEFRTDAVGRNRGPWLHVRLEPADGAAWTGAFELDPLRSPDSLTGLFGLPSGDELLVVAAGQGYVVPVRDPSRKWHRPPIAPVRGVRRVAGAPLVALWDFQDLAAYGPEGPRWRLDRLATDDLEVTGAAAGVIEGRLWFGWLPSDARVTFRVEAATGRLLAPAPHEGQVALTVGTALWDR